MKDPTAIWSTLGSEAWSAAYDNTNAVADSAALNQFSRLRKNCELRCSSNRPTSMGGRLSGRISLFCRSRPRNLLPNFDTGQIPGLTPFHIGSARSAGIRAKL